MPRLLFADEKGRVYDHPSLLALARSADELLAPAEPPASVPGAGRLVSLPGRLPVGLDPETGRVEVLDSVRVRGKELRPTAVGALLPPGYARIYLPAARGNGPPWLPQWAYTAAGWGPTGPLAWALRIDRRRHWDPGHYSTPQLAERVNKRLASDPENRALKQLETCALVYRCFTSQNLFYERDEGAIPASVSCNAKCVGCISEQEEGEPSHERMRKAPTGEEMGRLAARHLSRARGRTMVSFGQGCEGEPLTRAPAIEESIRFARARTDRGSININTNGSRPQALARLFDAGLDAVRVSLNSARGELYQAYYRPHGYGFEEVEASIALARKRKAYVALNLLTFPGVTDRLGEVEALSRLVIRHRVDQLQIRSLCMDPDQYLAAVRDHLASGPALGVRSMLRRLKSDAPWLNIGSFARGLHERRAG